MSQQQQQSETTNGQYNMMPRYPSPTAKYEDVAQSSQLFWEKLKAFHKSIGKKFKVPVVGGKALDLHQLFVEVTTRGGLEKVIRDRRWKEVIVAFRFPTTITSASFVLRKYYLSLLYHFEQVYYFRKQFSSVSTSGTASGSLVNGSANTTGDASTNQLAALAGTPELQIGSTVTGTIDGKFDNGYMVTVRVGSDQFKGVLYHIPQMLQLSQSANTTDVPPRRRRKRSQLALLDPSKPKSNRGGYNFFFTEQYSQLKPMYYGQEKAISKKIRDLWSNLTDGEKQVYQENEMKDKERYRTEMLEYRSSHDSTPQ